MLPPAACSLSPLAAFVSLAPRATLALGMASAHPSADDYVGFYLDSPTEEQIDELKALRARALDYPLEPGASLDWQGPNLHPESLPPADYLRDPPLPSPHEPRPLLSVLLAPSSPAGVGRGWTLRLLDGIQTGADKWSQVWRCEAVDVLGLAIGRVVLKLYHQALFPFPDADMWPDVEQDVFFWWPARHAEACESRAYRCVRPFSLSLGASRELTPCLCAQRALGVSGARRSPLLRLLQIPPACRRRGRRRRPRRPLRRGRPVLQARRQANRSATRHVRAG